MEDVNEIVDGTMRVFIPSGPMAVDYLANRITSFVSAGVKDGIPANGS